MSEPDVIKYLCYMCGKHYKTHPGIVKHFKSEHPEETPNYVNVDNVEPEPAEAEVERCPWLCPICEGRCGGVEGHGGQHQCPDPGHPRVSTEAFQVKLQGALDVIGELEAVSGVARVEPLFAVLLRRHNVSRADASGIIGVLLRDGAIYSPRPGYYKRTGFKYSA